MKKLFFEILSVILLGASCSTNNVGKITSVGKNTQNQTVQVNDQQATVEVKQDIKGDNQKPVKNESKLAEAKVGQPLLDSESKVSGDEQKKISNTVPNSTSNFIDDANFVAEQEKRLSVLNNEHTTFTLDNVVELSNGNSHDPTQLSPELRQQLVLMVDLSLEYIPKYREIVGLLRQGNIDAVVSYTSSCIVNDVGENAVRARYTNYLIPFFSDFSYVDDNDGSVVWNPVNGCSSEGILITETMHTISGSTRPFYVYLVKNGGKVMLLNITDSPVK